jgi:hypothetical protein
LEGRGGKDRGVENRGWEDRGVGYRGVLHHGWRGGFLQGSGRGVVAPSQSAFPTFRVEYPRGLVAIFRVGD